MTQTDKTAVEMTTMSNIALIKIQNPPVNALSKAVRIGLVEAVTRALKDDGITAIAISSEQALFSGGADISEFGGDAHESPLPEVLDVIEQATKPVFAVVNGPAFGGGLEVALACHYRISFADNKVGLPEVNLGILPGAGGTQRLPRLAGVAKSLDMIVTGKPAKVSTLPTVFDLIVDNPEQLLEQSFAFINTTVSKGEEIRRTCDLTVNAAEAPAELFEQYRRGIAKSARGFYSPERCIQAVEAAVNLPFNEGLKKEVALFIECMNSSESAAQRHIFFAERAAGHVSDFDKSTPVRDVKKVGIVGAGTMGGGIAMNFANAGIPVTLLELKQEALDKGLALIRRNYENSARKGKLTTDQVEQRMQLLTGTTVYNDFADVDLVIEAVFEKMSVKQDVFSQLDKVCKAGAILATNTSTLDINEIAMMTNRPQDVIGMHFFSPANVMKLLEVVKAESTSPDVIKTVMKLAKTIRKVSVLVGVCFGFVGNRMIETYSRESNRLLLEGATPEQVDRVIYDWGMPMGPFTMGDMAGLDIGYFVRESRREFIKHDPSYCIVGDKLVEKGRVGLKCGRGAYLYEKGQRKPIPDPDVIEIAKAEAARFGIQQREISDQEIIERCIYPLINEGANILQEEIAAKPSDIDVIYVYGYGFPVYRGGPMQYADQVGVKAVYDAMCRYQSELGEHGKAWFKPSPLLKKLIDEDQQFSDLNKG